MTTPSDDETRELLARWNAAHAELQDLSRRLGQLSLSLIGTTDEEYGQISRENERLRPLLDLAHDRFAALTREVIAHTGVATDGD